MIIATDADDAAAGELSRELARGYAAQMADLAAGMPVVPVVHGAAPYLDKVLSKARDKGDAGDAIAEVAPVVDGARAIAFGDIDPVADDGVIEKRYVPVGAEAAAWIDGSADRTAAPRRPRAPRLGCVELRCAALRRRARRRPIRPPTISGRAQERDGS
jgi:hypothetical protein